MILLLLLVMKLRVEELKNRESTVVEFLGGVSRFGQCNRVLLITLVGTQVHVSMHNYLLLPTCIFR